MKNIDIKKMAKEVVKTINSANKNVPQPYDTSGVVKRVEGSTVYVLFNGADEETPVSKTINCKAGDNVKLRVSDRKAWITGNVTAPPTDDKKAIQAIHIAENANSISQNIYHKVESGELNGINGDDAPKIVSITQYWCFSTSRSQFIKAVGKDWQTTIPEYEAEMYYWTKTITTYDDGSQTETDPILDLAAQTTAEAELVAEAAQQASEESSAAAQDAAEAADAAAQTASDVASEIDGIEAIANQARTDASTAIGTANSASSAASNAQTTANSASSAAAAAQAEASAATSNVTNMQKHFWYDSSSGAHVSEQVGSIASGYAVNATPNAVTMTRNGKMGVSLTTGGALNFYDENENTLASYNRAGNVLYTASGSTGTTNRKAVSLSYSGLTFFDPTKSTETMTAQYTTTGVNLYANGNTAATFGASSLNFYASNNLAATFGASAINFYDSAKEIASLSKTALNFYDWNGNNKETVATFNRSGSALYYQNVRSMSLTSSGLTFWDPTDTTTGSGQRKEAIFGSSGVTLYADNSAALTINSTNGITFANGLKTKIGNSSQYLEWTGSALNIRTNSLMIGGVTAATSSDITNVSNAASAAQSTADSASSAASAASTAASNAQSTADSASSAASNAQTTANSASSAASNAQTTANSASSAASNAQTTANSASSAASNAQTTANSASSAAAAAQSTAEDAATKATYFLNYDENIGLKVANDVLDATSYALISSEGLQVYKNDNQVASFGSGGAIIGEVNDTRAVIDNTGYYIYDSLDTEQFSVKAQGYTATTTKTVNFAAYKGESIDRSYAIASGTSIEVKLIPIGGGSGQQWNTTARVQNFETSTNVYLAITKATTKQTTFELKVNNTSYYDGYALYVKWTDSYQVPLIETIGDCNIGGLITASNVHEVLVGQVEAYNTTSTNYVSLSTAEQFYKFPLEEGIKIGSNLSISNKGIKCAKAGTILVSGIVQFLGSISGDIVRVDIRNGNTTVVQVAATASGVRFQDIIPPRLIQVNANDIIYIYVSNRTHGAGTAGGSSSSSHVDDVQKNYLTVQYV